MELKTPTDAPVSLDPLEMAVKIMLRGWKNVQIFDSSIKQEQTSMTSSKSPEPYDTEVKQKGHY